jgi:hypothetical protein
MTAPAEFPDNSYQARRAKKVGEILDMNKQEKTEPIKLRGKVGTKKKPIWNRFLDTFTGEDARSVVHSIIWDDIAPALRDMFVDSLLSGVERTLRGESGRPKDRRYGGYRPGSPYTSRHNYGQYSQQPRREERTRPPAGRARAGLDYRDITLDNRDDADDIIYALEDKISRFGNAAIADLYKLLEADEDDIEYTDHERGWYSARGFRADKNRDGSYTLVFPRPERLNG